MKLYNKYQPYILITLTTIISTIVLWLPFILKLNKLNFEYIYKHFDGLLYIIPAKTLYEVKKIDIPGIGFILTLPLSAGYFAAHLPLYPLMIRIFAVFFGYLKSMIGVNILFTVVLSMFFYYLVKQYKITPKPLLLTAIFLFLPRFLIVRSVGAPESLFMFLILASLYFFEKEKFFYAGILGGLATITKIPGILLFVSYILVFIESYIKKRKFEISWLYIFIIPFCLGLVFSFYLWRYGDFFAFFHSGASVPMPAPFSVFNSQAKWVGTVWLEDVLFYFFIYALSAMYLYNSKYRSFFYFNLVFFLGIIFVQHRDISRYSLPMWPMACMAFAEFFCSKKFVITLIILIPAIYLYAWNFILYNFIPVTVWAPFL